VENARASGRFTRVEVRREGSPGAARIVHDLAALPGVRLVEPTAPDLESTLVALAIHEAA